jgi:hypothetical protein
MRNGVGGCPRGMLSRVKTNVNGEGDAYYPFRPILAGKLASASLFGPCHGSHTQRCRPHASWSRRIDLTWEGYERLPSQPPLCGQSRKPHGVRSHGAKTMIMAPTIEQNSPAIVYQASGPGWRCLGVTSPGLEMPSAYCAVYSSPAFTMSGPTSATRTPPRGPQLLVDGRLDRSADVLVDQFAERDGLKLLRPRFFLDTLAHGVFLRWPPCKAARWSCTSPTGRMRHFSFPPDSGHDLRRSRLVNTPVRRCTVRPI